MAPINELPPMPRGGGRVDGPGPANGHGPPDGGPHGPHRADSPPPPVNQPPTTQTPNTGAPIQSGPPTPVQQPAQQPDIPHDAYRQPSVDYSQANTDLRGDAPVFKRPVNELVPDLRQTRALPEVAPKFHSDYQMVAKQVVAVPDTQPPERAQRAFEYFTKYAEKFVQLKQEPKPVTEPKQDPALPDLKNQDLGPKQLPKTDLEGQLDPKLLKDQASKDALLKDLLKDPRLQLVKGEPDPGGKPKSRLERLETQSLPFIPGGENGEGKGEAGDFHQRDNIWSNRDVKRLQEEQNARQQPGGKQLSEGDKKALASEFAESLRDLAFDQIHDERSGKNGVQKALELLNSKSLKEFQEKAQQTQMTAGDWPPRPPNPKSEELVKDQAPKQHAANEFTGAPTTHKEIGESPAQLSLRQQQDALKDGVELKVNVLQAEAGKQLLISPRDPQELRNDVANTEGERRTSKKLGGNMLFNVLHRFRQEGPDSAVEKEKWDRLTFGAMLFLILTTLVVIVLVSM